VPRTDLSAFRAWCDEQGRWSPRAVQTIVSRVRRADKVAPLSGSTSTTEYLRAVASTPTWATIPEASRKTIVHALEQYYIFASA
jgi:hypothetical protein